MARVHSARTPEWVEKIAAANRGRKLSAEHLQKLRGHPVSDETRKKIGDAQRLSAKAKRDADPEWEAKQAAKRKAANATYMRTREQVREKNLKHFYGLTLAAFQEMVTTQGGRCATCSSPFIDEIGSKFRANVDHDHETGKVRGLLCNRCNRAAGLLSDDPALLESLAAYLRQRSTECL